MAREEFIHNLRLASRLLAPPTVNGGGGDSTDADLGSVLVGSVLWLTAKAVEGFDPSDFADWPQAEQDELVKKVAAFRAIAERVPKDKPATQAQAKKARSYLTAIVGIVGHHLLHEWLEAQEKMVDEAAAAARAKGWHVDKDTKDVAESLLGHYKAPRLRIRTPNNEVVLDPIARFGSGRQGVVDLVIMPTYETAYLVAFKDGSWQIVSPHGTLHRRPLTRTTFVNTVAKLRS